jgi:hypothetical protein
MHATDSWVQSPKRRSKQLGRPPGKTGAQARTKRLARQVVEAVEDGTPLSYLVRAQLSWEPWRDDDRATRRQVERRLRRALKAAGAVDDLPVSDRISKDAVVVALRRFHKYSEAHSRQWGLFDGFAPYRCSAPRQYWQSAARLRTLHAELVRVKAKAARTDDPERATLAHQLALRLERQAELCIAEATGAPEQQAPVSRPARRLKPPAPRDEPQPVAPSLPGWPRCWIE